MYCDAIKEVLPCFLSNLAGPAVKFTAKAVVDYHNPLVFCFRNYLSIIVAC